MFICLFVCVFVYSYYFSFLFLAWKNLEIPRNPRMFVQPPLVLASGEINVKVVYVYIYIYMCGASVHRPNARTQRTSSCDIF